MAGLGRWGPRPLALLWASPELQGAGAAGPAGLGLGGPTLLKASLSLQSWGLAGPARQAPGQQAVPSWGLGAGRCKYRGRQQGPARAQASAPHLRLAASTGAGGPGLPRARLSSPPVPAGRPSSAVRAAPGSLLLHGALPSAARRGWLAPQHRPAQPPAQRGATKGRGRGGALGSGEDAQGEFKARPAGP